MLNLEAITQIVAFGDSLSDPGNSFALTWGIIPPEPNYYLGRFSNGQVAIEYLAQTLELPLNPYYDDRLGNNFAVGGAGTGENNSNNDNISQILPSVNLPGLANQINDFEKSVGSSKIDPNALYSVFVGPNDFLDYLGGSNPADPAVLIEQGVANVVNGITRLLNLGAQNLVVPNMPSLGRLPFSAGFQEKATAISIAFNGGLALALDNLSLGSKSSQVEVVQIDLFAFTEAIVADPEKFGLTNVTDPFLYSGLPLPTDPNQKTGFLFWDLFHPTTEAHELIANNIFQTVNGEIPQPAFNQIRGTSEKDYLFGTYREDNIDGFAGNDIILGFAGDDRIEGWEGNDWLFGNRGNDILSGGRDRDYLWGGRGDDLLFGDHGEDKLWGNRGKDILIGGGDRDYLWGGRGDDFLLGGDGDDRLRGDRGKDILIGGGGADTFELALNSGTDTIDDFQAGTDLIILSGGLTFNQLSFSGNQILVTATAQTLATLTEIDTTTLTKADFLL